MIKKTYIPGKPRNPKLSATTGTSGVGKSEFNQVAGSSHEHPNKDVLDQISQSNIDVLNLLSVVDGNIKVDTTLWTTGGLSALGLGEDGGGSGGGVDMLDSWANYTPEKANFYAPASLLVPFRDDTLSRLTSLESGSATSIETTGSGNAITSLTKSGAIITAEKGLTFSLSTHLHTGVYEPVFTKNTAFNKNFGTVAGTVAQGNDSRIINGQTAYGWGNHASAGYALNSALTTHTENSTIHITSSERTNWNLAYANTHTHGNKSVIDALTQGHINVLNKLSLDAQGNVKVDATLWTTGGLSALGLGEGGGGGGGVDMLDSWANYTSEKANYYVPASLLVAFRNDTLSRLTSLESGSATSIETTGSGNAVTSISKSGTVITANKGLTFALSSHTHTIAQITGLQTALDNKEPAFSKNTAFNKNFGTVAGTVAQGNDSRIINGQTAYGWGNHASAGYALNSALSGYVPTSRTITAGNGLTGGGALSANRTITLGTPSDITATSTNSVTASSHTHKLPMGSGSGLDADLLDGKQGALYRGEVKLPHIGDFEQVVIGLVNLDNSIAGRESWSSGQLYANRPNGTVWGALVVNYSLQKRYNASNMWAYLNTTTSGIDLCTFTYNGIKYGGIRFFPSATQVYGGLRLYGRWSDTTPFIVKYRNNSGVLNSEVDNSIVINGSDVLEQRLRTGSNTYAFTSDNVASATKLQTARTIAGVSFDGTANIAIPFANLSSKPNTLGGYGINDAYTKAESDTNLTSAINDIKIGGRNYFSINDFVADNKARGYSTIEVIQHEGNIAYRSSNIVNNHNVPRYLQGKFEANTQYYFKFNILWESYTNSSAQYIFQIRYTDGTISNFYANTSQTYRALLTAANKTINYISTSRQYDGTVVIYNVQIEKANKPSDWRPAYEDQVTLNTAQTITGAKTFSALLTASAGVSTPKVIFSAAGWSMEQVGSELQLKHNGVIKQRMLSNGTILATGGLTALTTN